MFKTKWGDLFVLLHFLLSVPNGVGRLIGFTPFLIKSLKQSGETYCFYSISYKVSILTRGDLLVILRFLLSLPTDMGRLIGFTPFLIKSSDWRGETYWFYSVPY